MKPKHALPIALLALALAILAGCGGAATGPVTLGYTFEEGQEYTYDVSMDMQGEMTGDPAFTAEAGDLPGEASMSAQVSMQVTDVDDQGVSTIEYTIRDVEVIVDGEAMPSEMGEEETSTIRIDQDGNLVSVDGDPVEKGLEGMQGLEGFDMSQLPFDPSQFGETGDFMFPEEGTAEPGDEWEHEATYPIPFIDQEITASSSGRLVSVEEREGREVANLEFGADVPLDLVIDMAQIFSSMGLDQMMSGDLQMEGMEDLEGLEGMEGLEGLEGMEGFELQMPEITIGVSGAVGMDGTASLYTESGFPSSMAADVSIDLTIDVSGDPGDGTELPEEPISIDYEVHVELNEA